jgi:rare lipoprotein A
MNAVPCLICACSIALLDACSTWSPGKTEKGRASYYSHHLDGCKTASGETYHANAYTAAHRKLPFGTKVCVKNLKNGHQVTLRINDRGPYAKGRIIDVSEGAARKLGMTKSGVVPVEVLVMNGRF